MKTNNKHSKRQKPLRTFSWSDMDFRTPTQQLIEDTVTEWYAAKHRTASIKEIKFVNSISY